jgi:hypothetical protein
MALSPPLSPADNKETTLSEEDGNAILDILTQQLRDIIAQSPNETDPDSDGESMYTCPEGKLEVDTIYDEEYLGVGPVVLDA